MKILKRLGYLIIFTLLAIIAMIPCMLYTILHPITKGSCEDMDEGLLESHIDDINK